MCPEVIVYYPPDNKLTMFVESFGTAVNTFSTNFLKVVQGKAAF